MGKGGGCFPSKSKRPAVSDAPEPLLPPDDRTATATAAEAGSAPETTVAAPTEPSKPAKLYIVYYSMYGHVEALARRMKKGADGVDGVEAVLYRVPETLPADVLEKMYAPPKDASVPEISARELEAADGILFGFPTRYGSMAAQMKAFFDSTGQLWKEQHLAGKPAGFFVSTGTQGGGQETTAWTSITQLAHHGMLFVPIGYTFGAGMFQMESVRGGSPYGAGVYAGDGSRDATDTELAIAEHQGKYMATIVKKLAKA